jgi:5-methylcytosine-specific restriction endonuclease McrA
MSASARNAYSNRPYRRLKEWARANLPPICAGCGHYVDWTIERIRHPMAATIDHVVPLSLGGEQVPLDRTMIRLMHRRCNSSRGNGTRVPRQIQAHHYNPWAVPPEPEAPSPRSRPW